MTRNTKLNDLQLILLATAAQRDGGNLYPLPSHLLDQGERVRKAISGLLRRQLISETPVADVGSTWRQEEDQRIGLIISEVGHIAINASDDEGIAATPRTDGFDLREPSVAPRIGSKSETVFNMLTRANGATLVELTDVTGWLPHTTRAALTGLRKKGHVVGRTKRGEVTYYSIAGAE